jgi:hypothetical protein
VAGAADGDPDGAVVGAAGVAVCSGGMNGTFDEEDAAVTGDGAVDTIDGGAGDGTRDDGRAGEETGDGTGG